MSENKVSDSKSIDQSATVKELQKQIKDAEKVIQKHETKAGVDADKIKSLEAKVTSTSMEKDTYYKAKIAELEEKVRSLEETSSNEDKEVFKNKRVTVHHGVVIPKMGTFTKEQILASKEAQDYLLEIKSSAISLNK